ncbi:MAG: hypothetical protein PHU44_14950 [Syntrophales bacterium]|nr:hypothetical protein [Syntrophales bacterium]MDD5640409.1 hypothetical protein [Syntrophales bacterium]
MATIAMLSAEWNSLLELTAYNNTMTITVSSVQKRTGDYSYKVGGYSSNFMQKTFPANPEIYLQYGLYMNNTFTGATFGLRSGGTWILSISRNASGYLEVRSGQNGTLLATGVTPTINGKWYVVELHLKLADSGGIVELRLDGNLECTFIGDTKPGSDTTVDNLYWISWGSGPEYFIDDVIVNDLSGSINNSWPGGLKLFLVKPVADAGPKEWTPSSGTDHYALLNELPPSGDDYLRATASDLIDLFDLEDLPAEAQSVKAVALDFFGLKGSTVAPSRIAQIVSLGGIDYVQADQDLPLAQGLVRKFLDTNPAGGNWNVATVNAMLSGIKSRP